MRNEDKQKFAEMMTAAFEIYGKVFPKGSMVLYWQILKRFDFADVERGLVAHLNNPESGQFTPKPADIIRYIDGSTQTRGMLAWSKVEKAVKRVGTYSSVVFDDALIHVVIADMGGWIELGKMTEQEKPFKARDFEKRYAGYAIQGGVAEHPKMLCGIVHHENSQVGIDKKDLVLVGNEELALRVYEGGGDLVALPTKRLGDVAGGLVNRLLLNQHKQAS